MSILLSGSLLKLPKLLWDLGTERIETTQTVLDLLAWVTVIAGDSQAGAENEAERERFIQTLQKYMALFFCVTVAGKGGDQEKRTILGPFVRLPLALQRRAIEIVFYSGAASTVAQSGSGKTKKDTKLPPLLAAVMSCCTGKGITQSQCKKNAMFAIQCVFLTVPLSGFVTFISL